VDATECVAIEDSHNGIASAKAAGMGCLAIPNIHFPPGDALTDADGVLDSIGRLDAASIERLDRGAGARLEA
jgi:beta-phosphoglucomutase-like phosphatase (HAD superfamily)